MIGVELATPSWRRRRAAVLQARALLLECGKKSIRFSPPLIITEAQATVAARRVRRRVPRRPRGRAA
jgi:acetylornithine/succinyldiaminopimelate/putrescine aminotransferase